MAEVQGNNVTPQTQETTEAKKKLQVKIQEPIHDKYEGIKKNIADKLRFYDMQYFAQDKPIPFKGLTIYPVIMKDYETFFMCTSCLTLNKDTNREGLRMSHLDYLISKMQAEGDEGASWSYKVQKLCEIVFHITNGLKCRNEECKNVLSYTSPEFTKFIVDIQEAMKQQTMVESGIEIPNITKPQLKCPKCGGTDFIEVIKVVKDEKNPKHYNILIDGHLITYFDFDLLRYLILYQNLPDYHDDSWVDPAIKKDYEERMRLESQKNGGSAHASVEKKVVALSITTNYKFEEIYNMSIRKFSIALKTVEDLIEYKITKAAMMTGLIDTKKMKLEHWIYKQDKDMYGDSYKTTDQVQAEIKNAA